ncbi:hypothetical protein DICPUDRAFT_98679 [Dictyostelium purpureum]|uniref:Succinate dehydrogenase cytochrome b560 subunit, mitochondrial n=1 Tax=Dictyostelium purpureum TaxID=5786 RepID=F0ZSK9_DICPU|nr:uncharacterized protein DICPUDRAFT_98679 [Dictyostelium purpureum]EGC33064.1 hypothetical protein DICPUDRAFT_98679 [Dictyostelium purpureum]|eukprot:XP_003290414.1 hypothetical protein DICPUDRAFT_98679 [Dictyostelium purpureum]
MFGRSLHSFTNKNFNPILKSLDRALVNTTYNSVSAPIIKPQRGSAPEVNYSTQPKHFTITEKKAEELRVPKQPTSPHVLIYRFPLPAVMSILHRVTGVFLGLGLFGVCSTALFAPQDVTVYIDMLKTNYPLLVYPAKFCIAFPLAYHTSTGIRHLFWDETQKGITTPLAESTCKIIIGIVSVATFIFTFFSFN